MYICIYINSSKTRKKNQTRIAERIFVVLFSKKFCSVQSVLN